MNIFSRTITGGLMIVIGFVLIGISFFTSFFILIYGLPIFVIGIFILLNKKEDFIEEIKYKRRSKK